MKNRRKIRKENRGKPVRIVVERVYLGGQSMEDAFRRINEDGVNAPCRCVGKILRNL